MKLLSVFCVTLIWHFGVSTTDRSDGIALQYQQNERTGDSQTNYSPLIDSQYNLNEIRHNWKQKKTIDESSQLYRSTTSLPENIEKSQGIFPKYINSQQFATSPLDKILPSIVVRNSKAGADKNGVHKLLEDSKHEPTVESNRLLISNKMESERQENNYNLLYNKQVALSRQPLTKLSHDSSLIPGENVRKRNWSRDILQPPPPILNPTLPTEYSPSSYQNEKILNWKKEEFENRNSQPRKIFERNINDVQRVEEEMKQAPWQQRDHSSAYMANLPNTYHYVDNLNRDKEEFKFNQNQPPTLPGGSIKLPDKTRLELQGLSSDNIASLLSTKSPENPFKLQVPLEPIGDTVQSGTASSQNPTAEILYKMKRAEPYRISDEQISHKRLDNQNVQNILNVKKLLDQYETDHPEKRYMLVHPDGKIEHIDNLEMVAAQFPHYISVKSSDIKKYASGHTNYLPTSLLHSLVKTKPTASQFTNVIQSPTVAIKEKTNNEAFTESLTSRLLTAVNTKSDLRHSSSVPVQNVTEMKQNISLQDQKTSLPLEIREDYHSSSLQDSNMAVNPMTKNIDNFDSNITVESLNATVFNTSKTLIEEVSIDKSSTQINMNAKVEDTSLENSTIVSPNFQENNDSFSNDSLIINETQSPDVLNTTDTENFNKSSNLATDADQNVTSITNTPIPSEEIGDKSGFWFEPGENFWDGIMNDTENMFYFLFVPPIPRAQREITRTIYPNGTIVEEVIEKINDEDIETIKSRGNDNDE